MTTVSVTGLKVEALEQIVGVIEQEVGSAREEIAAARIAVASNAAQTTSGATAATLAAVVATGARDAAQASALTLGAVAYAAYADLPSSAAPEARGYVYDDPDVANNGLWFWIGTGWQRDAVNAATVTQLQAEVEARSGLITGGGSDGDAAYIQFLTELRQIIARFGSDGSILTRWLSAAAGGGVSVTNPVGQIGLLIGNDGIVLSGARILWDGASGLAISSVLNGPVVSWDADGFRIGRAIGTDPTSLIQYDADADALRVNLRDGFDPTTDGQLVRVGRSIQVQGPHVAKPYGAGVNEVLTPCRTVWAGDHPERLASDFQGIVSMAKHGPRIFVAWERGSLTVASSNGEEAGNFGVLAYSDDSGATWTEANYFLPPTDAYPQSYFIDPVMFVDQLNRLWLVYVMANSITGSNRKALTCWGVMLRNPSSPAGRFSFSRHQFLGYGAPSHVATIDGEQVMPICYWRATSFYQLPAYWELSGKNLMRFDASNRALAYYDRAPFIDPADATLNSFDEFSVAQTADGQEVFGLFRTTVGLSWTRRDADGEWSPPEPFDPFGVGTTTSRAVLFDTVGGRIGLVWNNSTTRSNLSVSLSEDGGRTWCAPTLLDDRTQTTYPAVWVDGDDIHVTHDYNRTLQGEVRYHRVSEAAVWSGAATVTSHQISQNNVNV